MAEPTPFFESLEKILDTYRLDAATIGDFMEALDRVNNTAVDYHTIG